MSKSLPRLWGDTELCFALITIVCPTLVVSSNASLLCVHLPQRLNSRVAKRVSSEGKWNKIEPPPYNSFLVWLWQTSKLLGNSFSSSLKWHCDQYLPSSTVSIKWSNINSFMVLNKFALLLSQRVVTFYSVTIWVYQFTRSLQLWVGVLYVIVANLVS